MDQGKELSPVWLTSFRRTFERHGGKESTWPMPNFDAICLVLGEKRNGFDTKGFFGKYPSARNAIIEIRKLISSRNKELFED